MTYLARNPRLSVAGTDVPRPVALNIGEVLSELQGEFSQVTASKIRFLEEKGLLTPQRTSAGYRSICPTMWGVYASFWDCSETSTYR